MGLVAQETKAASEAKANANAKTFAQEGDAAPVGAIGTVAVGTTFTPLTQRSEVVIRYTASNGRTRDIPLACLLPLLDTLSDDDKGAVMAHLSPPKPEVAKPAAK